MHGSLTELQEAVVFPDLNVLYHRAIFLQRQSSMYSFVKENSDFVYYDTLYIVYRHNPKCSVLQSDSALWFYVTILEQGSSWNRHPQVAEYFPLLFWYGVGCLSLLNFLVWRSQIATPYCKRLVLSRFRLRLRFPYITMTFILLVFHQFWCQPLIKLRR